MYDIGICDDGFEICGFIQKVIKEYAATHLMKKNWEKNQNLQIALDSFWKTLLFWTGILAMRT